MANKIDDVKNRVVNKDQGEEIARKNNWEYIETSAKNDIQIDKIFPKVVEVMLMRYKDHELTPKKYLYVSDENLEEEDAGGMGCC